LSAATEEELGATAVLKKWAPVWWWLRENFKLPSVGAIAGILASATVWIWHQHTDLVGLEGQLKGLATADQIRELAGRLDRFADHLDDQDNRLGRLEDNWDHASGVAADFRVPRKRGGFR